MTDGGEVDHPKPTPPLEGTPPPPPPEGTPPPPPPVGPPLSPPTGPPPPPGALAPPPPRPEGLTFGAVTPAEVPPPPRRRRGLWIALGIVGVVVVLAGVLSLTVFKSKTVGLPDQIDGVSRITTGPLATLMDRAKQDPALEGHDSVAGIYGSAGSPEFLFLAAQGTESAAEDEKALRGTASRLGSGGDLGLDTSSLTTKEVDGVTYRCAPLTGQLTGSACLWNDGDTLGAVFTFSDRGDPTAFASHVHDAVVS